MSRRGGWRPEDPGVVRAAQELRDKKRGMEAFKAGERQSYEANPNPGSHSMIGTIRHRKVNGDGTKY